MFPLIGDAEHFAVPWADALVMFDAAHEITLSTIRPENGRAIRGYGSRAYAANYLQTVERDIVPARWPAVMARH
jgi:hypothetical protein